MALDASFFVGTVAAVRGKEGDGLTVACAQIARDSYRAFEAVLPDFARSKSQEDYLAVTKQPYSILRSAAVTAGVDENTVNETMSQTVWPRYNAEMQKRIGELQITQPQILHNLKVFALRYAACQALAMEIIVKQSQWADESGDATENVRSSESPSSDSIF